MKNLLWTPERQLETMKIMEQIRVFEQAKFCPCPYKPSRRPTVPYQYNPHTREIVILDDPRRGRGL